jgi:hypothetical protein
MDAKGLDPQNIPGAEVLKLKSPREILPTLMVLGNVQGPTMSLSVPALLAICWAPGTTETCLALHDDQITRFLRRGKGMPAAWLLRLEHLAPVMVQERRRRVEG